MYMVQLSLLYRNVLWICNVLQAAGISRAWLTQDECAFSKASGGSNQGIAQCEAFFVTPQSNYMHL